MTLRVGHHTRVWVTLIAIGLLLGLVPAHRAQAVLEGCSVSLVPHSADAGIDSSFSFTITNNASSSIEWVKIVAPPGGIFTVEAGSANHWTANNTSNDATFTNWSLPPGRNQNFVVEAFPNSGSGPVNWTVLASDDPAGAGNISCSGDTSVTVTPEPIAISNVQVSGVTATSATITWDTNVPGTSQVNYGTDSSYGSSSPQDSNLVSSHSVTLTGLDSGTGYHYSVTSTAAGGSSTASSPDDTFLTANSGGGSTPPGGGGSGVSNNSHAPLSLPGGLPLLARPAETIPPTVNLTTVIPRVVKYIPVISGVAHDNVALARIEYSTDGGQNWLPVDQVTGLGGQSATFSFTPIDLQDGNYELVVRAVDTSGNIGLTPTTTMVVDRLPPIVGGNIFSLGPQILAPDQQGVISSLVNLNQKVTLSAIGGPISIVLKAVPQGRTGKPQRFALTKSAETGLWSGIVSFSNPGRYTLLATAVDGAGNTTNRTLNAVSVSSTARTIDKKTGKGLTSQVTLYYQAPDSNSWVVWDGSSYGQQNPQITNKQGDFQLLLPPGKYYLKATAPHYHILVSRIFEAHGSQPLTATLALRPVGGLSVGSLHLYWPSFTVQSIALGGQQLPNSQNFGQGSLVGRSMPDFTLTATDGATVHSADLLGKPTVISFGATWSPTTAEQLQALADLQPDPAFNIVPVALQDNLARVEAYNSVAGLNLRWLVDPDSTTVTAYGVQSLPTHYFVDRKGVIKQVIVGVLTKQQLIDQLSGL